MTLLYRLIIALVALAAAWALDGVVFRDGFIDQAQRGDWHRLLRVTGYLPTWIAVATAFALHDRALRRAVPLLVGAAGAGLAAEVLKLLVRRERPGPLGEVVFRPFSEDLFNSAPLGMPSSHAAVAFGAAFILWRLHPRIAPVVLLMALGCGMSRVVERSHFLSDVIGAAIVAEVVVLAVAAAFVKPRRRGSRLA